MNKPLSLLHHHQRPGASSWRDPIPAIDRALALSLIRLLIETGGRTVAEETDFQDVWAEACATAKSKINKESNPGFSDLTDGDVKYIVVRSDQGSMHGFICIRRIKIGGGGLLGYLSTQYRRIYGGGEQAFCENHVPPVLHEIKGDVVCLSDIYVDPAARKKGLTPEMLYALGFTTAALWEPDWMYGFTQEKDFGRGLGRQYMPSRSYPSALEWLVETPNRKDTDWILCWDSQDISYVLRHICRKYRSMIEIAEAQTV